MVDLQALFNNMKCVDCANVSLKFKDAVGVLPAGICGHLVIRCYNCLRFVQVAMGKTHSSPHGQQIFDVNTKLATGMYHSGIGPVQLNNLFTSMNLPNISESLIRRRCDEVGPVLEDLAEESTSKALCEEGHLSATNSIESTGITASADGAYQRRGSGRCYNSLSGTATLIGKRTGKIVGFSARYKRCRKCDVAKAKHRTPNKHACKKNWTGTAKSMEPDMIVEILKEVKDKNNPVVTLIGDDDCTAFNRARCEVSSCIEKLSDKNHVKKNISNKLYKLKSKHKELSVKTITAIMKSFSYMLAQCKEDTDKIEKSIDSVVLHQFGDHVKCGEWCNMKENPTARHKNLPWGADLQNEKLKTDLLTLFRDLDPSKLSRLDSSNCNESFNNTLRSKAPKDKHYSESGSLAYRLSAAVCQKNEGYSYVAKVHEKLGLSPGTATTSLASIRDRDVHRKREVSKTKEFKLQRQKLKSERSGETRSQEVREGDSYSSNLLGDTPDPDMEVIPGPSDVCNAKTIVYYDLETTGLTGQHQEF